MSLPIARVRSGVKTSSSYRLFRPFCKGWQNHLQAYYQKVGEWPFWYGERPLIGFLATGIWSSKAVCIEEFAADKKAQVAEPKKAIYPGRGDLYFSNGDRDGNVEFKMHDVGISQAQHFDEFVERKWRVTKGDALKGKSRGIESFGGMFLRPYLGKSRDVDMYKANLAGLLTCVWDSISPDALAWWCPIEDVIADDQKTKNLIVGAILVMKKVR